MYESDNKAGTPTYTGIQYFLKKLFLKGQYEPGERIIELQFAEKLGNQ